MTFSDIKTEHITKAIGEVDQNGIPKGRMPKKYLLEYNNEYYPPKYVFSLAYKYASGEELNPSKFWGMEKTNLLLKNLGFKILEIPFLLESSPEKDMTMPLKKSLVIKMLFSTLKNLPEEKVKDVFSFALSLLSTEKTKKTKPILDPSKDPILELMGIADVEPCADKIDEELYGKL